MNTTLFEKMQKAFQKLAFIKTCLESGMTLEQAIQESSRIKP